MDVVVKNIQSVGGSLEIDSVEGQGSTMTLQNSAYTCDN